MFHYLKKFVGEIGLQSRINFIVGILKQFIIRTRLFVRGFCRKSNLKIPKVVVTFAFLASILFGLFTTFGIGAILCQAPDVRAFLENPEQSSQIYDVHNHLIANIQADEDREVIKLKQISPWLRYAVISIEDNRFYKHHGIDAIGTLRAGMLNASGNSEVQGGSTLTQQLIKNTFLINDRTVRRKFVEALLAVRVEHYYSKDQILEFYLNRIYWGNLCFGAQKASKKYFNKNASQLTLAEASFMAGLLKAPEGLSPYHNYPQAKKRQHDVLDKMMEYGYISKKQMQTAYTEKLKICKEPFKLCKYPYFVEYVIQLIDDEYGAGLLRRGGLKIYTTMDPQVQNIAQATIENGIKSLPKRSVAKQGALVSINARNGYIQAIVGGADFAKSNFNRATQAKRAAGSSFKPIVYLTGFRLNKINSQSAISDTPVCLRGRWNTWCPHNWDGRYFGRMTVKKALSTSRNTCTVKVALKTGIDEIIKTARMLGLKGHIDHNFTIVLGSPGISPLEMATVYTTFARDGSYIEPIAIRQIENANGEIIKKDERKSVQVVNNDYVRQLNDILIDVVQKGTAMDARLSDRIVAGKTGTTDKVRDIWFTGYTPDTVTTIWLGNDEYRPLRGMFSSNCAQLWKNFSQKYYKAKKIPPTYFIKPDNSKLLAQNIQQDTYLAKVSVPKTTLKRYRRHKIRRKPVIVKHNKIKFTKTIAKKEPVAEKLDLRAKKEIPTQSETQTKGE